MNNPCPLNHDPLGVDQALVLLALAHDRQIGLAVVGVPVRVFLADEIDDLVAARLAPSHQPVDSGLGHRCVVPTVEIGMADEEQFLASDAIEAVTSNTALAGREGEHYREALRLLNRAEAAPTARSWG